jgi:LemA protein
MTTLGISFIVALLVALTIWLYNKLVHDKNLVANAWSDIDVQLMRRHDLVPQLVSAVQAYTNYERATLSAVTALRSQSEHAPNLASKAAVEDAVDSSVQQLIAVAEDYPDLKADQNFRQLSEELVNLEDHLQYARRFYNGAVRQLNTRVASFPHMIVARLFGFHAAEFFEAGDQAVTPPLVSLN